jgi:hypothetical protein
MFIAEENQLREVIEIPKDRLHLLSKREPGETLSHWADRCGVLYNVMEESNEKSPS